MKQFILIALSAFMAFASLSLHGCSDSKTITDHTINSYEEETVVEIDDTSKESGESREESVNNSYSIKKKEYDYQGETIVVLSVTNNTKQDHILLLTGKYYDQDGNLLTQETKKFEGFYSGYQNFFLFKPDIEFDEFDYTIEVEPYSDTCYAKEITLTVPKIEKTRSCITELAIQGDFQKYPTLMVYISGGNNSDIDLIVPSHVILINEKGEIVGYKSHMPNILANTEHGIDFDGWELYQSTEEFEDWPEELQGTLSAIVCIDEVSKATP